MKHIFINLYLLAGSYQDIKSKSIKNWYLWLGGVIGLFFLMIDWKEGQREIYEWIFRFIPGILFLFYGKVSREKVGYGDGWLVIILGSLYSWIFLCRLLMISLFLTVLAAGFLIVIKKGTKESRLPYLPFLWMAHIVLWGYSGMNGYL